MKTQTEDKPSVREKLKAFGFAAGTTIFLGVSIAAGMTMAPALFIYGIPLTLLAIGGLGYTFNNLLRKPLIKPLVAGALIAMSGTLPILSSAMRPKEATIKFTKEVSREFNSQNTVQECPEKLRVQITDSQCVITHNPPH